MTKKDCLIISETVFCDVEKNRDALNDYFERLKICLLSISNIDAGRFVFQHILYVSSDKKEYSDKIKKFISDNDIGFVKLVEYHHPEEGYSINKGDHIDLIKNPNRTSGRRDQLFEKAEIEHHQYNSFLRIAIDDDDAWLSGHLTNVMDLAECLSFTVEDDFLIAGGIFSTYLAKVEKENGRVLLENVELDRAVCGNKFYFSDSYERLRMWSPWSIPDVIDEKSIDKFKEKYKIDLFALRRVDPGFVYFRRGLNLSSQNKNWCTTEIIDSHQIASEKEVIKVNEKSNSFFKAEVLGHLKWHSFCEYDDQNSVIHYDFPIGENLDEKKVMCAYYLYKNGKLVEKKGYSKKFKDFFKISPGKAVYEVVCFLKNKEMLPVRIKSSKIYVR